MNTKEWSIPFKASSDRRFVYLDIDENGKPTQGKVSFVMRCEVSDDARCTLKLRPRDKWYGIEELHKEIRPELVENIRVCEHFLLSIAKSFCTHGMEALATPFAPEEKTAREIGIRNLARLGAFDPEQLIASNFQDCKGDPIATGIATYIALSEYHPAVIWKPLHLLFRGVEKTMTAMIAGIKNSNQALCGSTRDYDVEGAVRFMQTLRHLYPEQIDERAVAMGLMNYHGPASFSDGSTYTTYASEVRPKFPRKVLRRIEGIITTQRDALNLMIPHYFF